MHLKHVAHKKQLEKEFLHKQELLALYNGSNLQFDDLREHYISDAADYITDFHKFLSIQQVDVNPTSIPSIDYIPTSAQLAHLTRHHGPVLKSLKKEF